MFEVYAFLIFTTELKYIDNVIQNNRFTPETTDFHKNTYGISKITFFQVNNHSM